MGDRSQRMIDSAPAYYQLSNIYTKLQEAIAADLDSLEIKAEDLQLQLYIPTATWGLKYWEDLLGIKTVETDGYEIRRSRVLGKWRSPGNFSAVLVKNIAEAFTNGEVVVTVNLSLYQVKVTFISTRGVPPNLEDLQAQIEDVVHAHLELIFEFTYLRWSELEAAAWIWNYLDSQAYTWDTFETLKI